MRYEYSHSTVTGIREKERGGVEIIEEDFIHLRLQDPILMACKRNHDLAACGKISVRSEEAFSRWIDEPVRDVRPAAYYAAAVPEYEW